LNRQLDAIVTQVLPSNFSISLQVADLATGRILMEKNPDLALVPASTMKIVTSSAAFGCLQPDFTFATEVLADDVKGRSVGNIYLKGSGDPYLVSEELFALTRKVRDEGLVEVRGNIVVDDSYFVPDKPLDEQERLGTRAYHAPYSALSLNFNTIWIVVNPGSKPGDPAEVLLDPASEYATLKASVKTVQGSAPAKVSIEKECTPSGRDVISVTGSVGLNAPIRGRYANVSTPSLYTGEVFKEFLLREGIRVFGKVVRGTVPSSAVSHTKHDSRPLAMIIYGLNKFSNNFMAEQISLAMGAAVHGEPGTREKGLLVIRKHLLDLGVDERALRLSEASGLSRNNRLSSSALVRVLLASARDFKYNSEFIASFGVAGVDGTLKERFTDSAAKRRIRAKTGNLRGVNALAGYGLSRGGRTLVFAVIVNSLKEGTGFIDYGDRIIRSVLDLPIGKN
jgi:D-alanyl-D-alanine carboxypeptidase/D-alanyl-D-alanine-endopeptidase (penicillin-binding protein 4)